MPSVVLLRVPPSPPLDPPRSRGPAYVCHRAGVRLPPASPGGRPRDVAGVATPPGGLQPPPRPPSAQPSLSRSLQEQGSLGALLAMPCCLCAPPWGWASRARGHLCSPLTTGLGRGHREVSGQERQRRTPVFCLSPVCPSPV